jgi:hypothetical protein
MTRAAANLRRWKDEPPYLLRPSGARVKAVQALAADMNDGLSDDHEAALATFTKQRTT